MMLTATNRDKQIERLVNTPVNKLDDHEARLLKVIMMYGDSFDVKTRDLISTVPVYSWQELKEMILIVDSYNDFDATKVIASLSKHQRFIDFRNTHFGRDYSPVMWLGLDEYSKFFQTKANALGKDLIKQGLCDELQWCYFRDKVGGDFLVDQEQTFKITTPEWGENRQMIGCHLDTVESFRQFRVWWD